jgi:DegV family protein with EDD domain
MKASEEFRGRCDIQVIDSESMSVGLGMLVQVAVETVAKGRSFEEVVRAVRGMIPRLYMVYFLEDLFYLEKNRMVSKSQALLGNMLGIIPFLTIEHGRMIPMEKVRSRARALEKLVEFVTEFSITERLAVLHHKETPDEEALLVGERLQSFYPKTSISFLQYSPTVATHIGLNGLGVVVLESEEEAL